MKGSIREKDKGVWEFRIYVGRDPSTKRPKQISRTFRGGKRAATTELARLVTEATEGHHGGTNATLEVLLDAWLADAKGRVSPATYVIYEDTVDRVKTTDLILMRLSRLSSFEIDACYTSLRDGGTTPHQMVQTHRYLRTALRQGVSWGWLRADPSDQAHAPKAPGSKPPLTSVAELYRIIEAAESEDPDLACIIFLAALTGLRRAELCGLRWSDISNAVITLNRRHIIVRGAVVEMDATKGRQKGDEDVIRLGQMEPVVLEHLRSLQLERARELGVALPADGWLMSIDGMGGTPRRPDKFGKQMSAAGKRAGIKTNPHKMRHFMATEFLARGTPITQVSDRLRHRDKALTLRQYIHGDQVRDVETANEMGQAIGVAFLELPA